MAPRIQASAGADVVQERGFFEYHLYEIGRDVTLRNGQSKQIEFTTAPSVPVTKTYVLDLAPQYWGHTVTDPGHGAGSQDNAQVHIEFINDQDGGLGIPLPGGTVRLYKEDADGAVEFVGEDTVGHTPSEAKLSLHVGDAFDITGERLQVDFNQLGKRSIEETIQVSIRNHKDTEVVVKVVEDLFRARDAEIVESSQKYVLTDAHTAEFSLSIEAGGEAEIEYTVRYEW